MPTKRTTKLGMHQKNLRQKSKKLHVLSDTLGKATQAHDKIFGERKQLMNEDEKRLKRSVEIGKLLSEEKDAEKYGKLTFERIELDKQLHAGSQQLAELDNKLFPLQEALDKAQTAHDREKGFYDKLEARIKAEIAAAAK